MEKKHKKDNRRMKLQPGISTHFRWMLPTEGGIMTKNKVYPIVEWRGEMCSFLNDHGGLTRWSVYYSVGMEDCSFKTNLDKVLD